MTLKFAHIRSKDSRGNFLPGGFTLAYNDTPFDIVNGETTIQYAVAHCSPKDNFNKKLGRAIAEGRFKSETFTVIVDAVEENDIVNKLAELEQRLHDGIWQLRYEHKAAKREAKLRKGDWKLFNSEND